MRRLKDFLRVHCVKVLEEFEKELQSKPGSTSIDKFGRSVLAPEKELGANDRNLIIEAATQAIKQKIYLDAISSTPLTWDSRLETLYSKRFYEQQDNPALVRSVKCACPTELWNRLTEEYGEDKAFEFMRFMNEEAPMTIRANPLRIARKDLFEKLRKKYRINVKRCQHSPFGITLLEQDKKLFEIPEYQKGFFEVQDEASQLAALRVDCKPGDIVLDYCAGHGSNSLTFGPQLKGAGQIYLHDWRYSQERTLSEAKKRFTRSGISNIQFHQDNLLLKNLVKKVDWVVLEAPSTGTGILRRSPDLKLKFSSERLKYHLDLQMNMINEAIKYLKPSGRFVYITTSLLPQENLFQIVKTCEKHDMEIENEEIFQTLPGSGEMDSYFSTTLKFKD